MGENNTVPFLPGYSFSDPTKTSFPLSQTLRYDRGCTVPKIPAQDTAKEALELYSAQNRMFDDAVTQLTYGPRRTFLLERAVPDYVSFDKKVLRFFGYYRENINDSWGESFRIHHVKVLYYLEDDTMEIWEPKVPNSGLVQGLLLKRQKLPHPNGQDMYHWKDLNIAIELVIYGKGIHLVDCDEWTQEYLYTNGVILNPKVVDIPEDPYLQKLEERKMMPIRTIPNPEDSKLLKFLNQDKMVLRFYGLWDDTASEPYQKRKVVILFYLVDDTVEIHVILRKNDGQEPCGVLMKRKKIPADLKAVEDTFPSCYLEYTDNEVEKWLGPSDLGIGKTVVILNRPIFIYDCDKFTREFYKTSFGVIMPEPVEIKEEPKKQWSRTIAPHDGFGTWEDSLQSCIYNQPKPPKKDVMKMLLNDDKFLRYSAYIETFSAIDRSRKFIITFFPADDTVKIHERPIPNSGMASGPFLKRCRLLKGFSPQDNRPVYYDASDFYIGATISACGRKFIIDNADKHVLKFMEGNPHIYNEAIIQAHRKKTVAAMLATEPLHSQKSLLEHKMREYVVESYGKDPLPILLDLGEGECEPDLVKDKIFAANVPVQKAHLDEAMDLCSTESGKIDVTELQKILVYSFGQHLESNQ